MTNEPDLRTKTDVFDLVISFLMEHEKQMATMLDRIEKITERLAHQQGYSVIPSSIADIEGIPPSKLTIAIDNPEGYGPIKSIKIDWEKPAPDKVPSKAEVLSFLEEIERIYQKD